MSRQLEKVARARDARIAAEEAFRRTLVEAKQSHSWAELADAARMSRTGVKWLVEGGKSAAS
jgi:hypothetical protein